MLRLDPRLTLVKTLAFSPDSRHLLAVGSRAGLGGLLRFNRLALWDLSDPAAKPEPGIDRWLNPIAGYFLPDGRMLGVDSRGTWEAGRPGGGDAVVPEAVARPGRFEPAAVSPDGQWLALFGQGSVEVEPLTGDLSFERFARSWEATLDSGQEATGAAFSPGSDALAVAVRGWAGVEREWGITVYAAGTGEFLQWVNTDDEAFAPRWSPDGRVLVAVGRAGFEVFDAEAWEPLAARRAEGRLAAAAFHPSGRFLATAGEAGRVHLWDAGTWGDPGRPADTELDWGVGRVQALAFSPDGTLGAAVGDRGDVVVWDVDVGW